MDLRIAAATTVDLRRGRGSPGTSHARRWAMAMAMAMAVTLSGCLEDDPERLVLAPSNCGRIQGAVRGPTGPIAGEVEARSLSNHASYSVAIEAAGDYELFVPHGQYEVWIEAGTGLSLPYSRSAAYDRADTIETTPIAPTCRADFLLGAIRADVRWPADLAGARAWLLVHVDGSGRTRHAVWSVTIPDSLRSVAWIDGLPPGRATLEIDIRDDRSVLREIVYSAQEADSVDVRVGEISNIHREVAEACRLQATLRGSWALLAPLRGGKLPSSTTLEAWSSDSVEVFSVSLTPTIRDDRATFEVDVRGSGAWRFSLRPGQQAFWCGGDDFHSAPEYAVRPGASVDLPEIVESGVLCHLEPGLSFTGSSASVKLVDSRGIEIAQSRTGSGGLLGGYGNVVCFSGLRGGAYFMQIETEGCDGPWLSRWYPDAVTREASRPIDVAGDGRLVEVVWDVPLGGTIRGTFDSAIVDLARVAIYLAADTSAVFCQASPSMSGSAFRFEGLEDGDYLLRCDRLVSQRMTQLWYPASRNAAGAETLRVRDHVGPAGLRWTLP